MHSPYLYSSLYYFHILVFFYLKHFELLLYEIVLYNYILIEFCQLGFAVWFCCLDVILPPWHRWLLFVLQTFLIVYMQRTSPSTYTNAYPIACFAYKQSGVWQKYTIFLLVTVFSLEVVQDNGKEQYEEYCLARSFLCYILTISTNCIAGLHSINFEVSHQDKVASAASFTLIEAGLCSFSALCRTSCSCLDLLPEIPSSTISNTSTKQSWYKKMEQGTESQRMKH